MHLVDCKYLLFVIYDVHAFFLWLRNPLAHLSKNMENPGYTPLRNVYWVRMENWTWACVAEWRWLPVELFKRGRKWENKWACWLLYALSVINRLIIFPRQKKKKKKSFIIFSYTWNFTYECTGSYVSPNSILSV